MSIQSEVFASTSKAQAGVAVAAGDRFLRGTDVVVVDGVDTKEGRVTWTEPVSGVSTNTDSTTFRERALTRLTAPAPPAGMLSLVAAVWAIVGSRSLATSERLALVAKAFPGLSRLLSADDLATVHGWLTVLRSGKEPAK